MAGWGYFLIQGVRDPDGGIKALWPLFGIANQLLASIALCLATTVVLKMQFQLDDTDGARSNQSQQAAQDSSRTVARTTVSRPVFALVTLVPLLWLLSVTLTAGLQTIFHHESDPKRPRIGFLQKAAELDEKLPALNAALASAEAAGNQAALAAARKNLRDNRMLHFNNLLDAVVTGIFLVLASMIFLLSVREWILLLARRRLAILHETPPVWLPEYAVVEAQPLRVVSLLALALGLAKELSGEAHLERARQAVVCDCARPEDIAANKCSLGVDLLGNRHDADARKIQQQLYVESVEQRFKGVNRCC